MDSDEYAKVIDNIYKNILEKFNPGARQLINAGKAYLKALHGSAAASNLYIEAIVKLARDAQQADYGASSDVGNTLMKVMEVCKEIQDQQMNILKAFYVDLLLPLETNLEKDTKVVQLEQKRFMHQHKQYTEMYNKAVSTMKKQRKKCRSSSKNGLGMDKELKTMQILEEEKTKLDAFCERSLKNALTQERRRYGFVLERQCSLAKHCYSFYNHSTNLYQKNVDEWNEVAKTREILPGKVEKEISSHSQIWPSSPLDDIYSNLHTAGHHHRYNNVDDDSFSTRLRKSKSMDTSCLDLRSKIDDAIDQFESLNLKNNRNSLAVYNTTTASNGYGNSENHLNGHGLIRAKSEFNLASMSSSSSSPQSNSKFIEQNNCVSMKAVNGTSTPLKKWEIPIARALYAYLSSGENQLTFLEGDILALIGERNKGWQYGENLRTQTSGWFPLAYTEILDECISSSSVTHHLSQQQQLDTINDNGNNERNSLSYSKHHLHQQQQPPQYKPESENNDNLENNTLKRNAHVERTRMFGDTFNLNKLSTNSKAQSGCEQLTSPPQLPAPVPGPHPNNKFQNVRKSISVSSSLHSSNDSGFVNDQQHHSSSMEKIDEDEAVIKRIPFKNDNSEYKSRTLSPPLVTNLSYFQPIENHHYPQHHKKLSIKRTKSSFWKFGKNSSDSEILEGMAMWKHRDLMDTVKAVKSPYVTANNNNSNHEPSDDDSEKTLTTKSKGGADSEFENQFRNGQDLKSGLKTVNRKDILQKYDDSSSHSSSLNDLSPSSDAVENTTVTIAAATTTTVTTKRKSSNKNVVSEIGKKLEIMSKSMQSPNEARSRNSYVCPETNRDSSPQPRSITSDYDYDYDDEEDEYDRNNNSYYFANSNNGEKKMQFLPRVNSQKKTNGGGSSNNNNNGSGGGNGDIYGAWYDLWEMSPAK